MREKNDGTHDAKSLLVNSNIAARLLSISPRTLFDLTKSGEVPHVRIGRLVRYDPADLTAWIEQQKGK